MTSKAYTVAIDTHGGPISAEELIKAMRKAKETTPAINWVLMAPDGRVYADPDPVKILQTIMQLMPGDALAKSNVFGDPKK